MRRKKREYNNFITWNKNNISIRIIYIQYFKLFIFLVKEGYN